MDLSKVFHSINHDFLIAKLHAYGYSKNVLKLLLSCISDRWQKIKIGWNFSASSTSGVSFWPNFIEYLPKWFIFYTDCNICFDCNICNINFADTTPYVCEISLVFSFEKWEEHSNIIMNWFEKNYMMFQVIKNWTNMCWNTAT